MHFFVLFFTSWSQIHTGISFIFSNRDLTRSTLITLKLSLPCAVILLPAHPASFAHKFLFQRVLASPGMQ